MLQLRTREWPPDFLGSRPETCRLESTRPIAIVSHVSASSSLVRLSPPRITVPAHASARSTGTACLPRTPRKPLPSMSLMPHRIIYVNLPPTLYITDITMELLRQSKFGTFTTPTSMVASNLHLRSGIGRAFHPSSEAPANELSLKCSCSKRLTQPFTVAASPSANAAYRMMAGVLTDSLISLCGSTMAPLR
jgi:hypothetical protein